MRVVRMLLAIVGVTLLAAAPAAAGARRGHTRGHRRAAHGHRAHGHRAHGHGRTAHDHGPPGQPQVSSVSPASGSGAGGTEVTISGRNLLRSGPSCSLIEEITSGTFAHGGPGGQLSGCAAIVVYFGTEPGLVAYASAEKVDVFSPPHLPGSVAVGVLTPAGMSRTHGRAAQFRYTSAPPGPSGVHPVVVGVSPGDGLASGFVPVTITGEHLLPAAAGACVACARVVVRFGGSAVPVLEGTQDQLLAVAPPHPPGDVQVAVVVEGAASPRSAGAHFTYTASRHGHGRKHTHGHKHGGPHGRHHH